MCVAAIRGEISTLFGSDQKCQVQLKLFIQTKEFIIFVHCLPCLWVVLFWRNKPTQFKVRPNKYTCRTKTKRTKRRGKDLALFTLTQGCGTEDFSHLDGTNVISVFSKHCVYPKEAVMVLRILDQLTLERREERRKKQLDASNHLSNLRLNL